MKQTTFDIITIIASSLVVFYCLLILAGCWNIEAGKLIRARVLLDRAQHYSEQER